MLFLIHIPGAIALVLLFSSLISSPIKPVTCENLLMGGYCLKSGNYTANSPYHTNVLSVLSSLTSKSREAQFANVIAGEPGPDQVHGLFICRADLSLSACQACVNLGATKIVEKCTDKKEAIIWFEECTIWYTNQSISSFLETDNWQWSASYFNVSRPDLFPSLLNSTMQGIITNASSVNNTLRFATGKANFTGWESLYGLAQCVPDISASECGECLRLALARVKICCGGLNEWTYVGLPSCSLHYDTAPFFYMQGPRPLASATEPLTPPPASSSAFLLSVDFFPYLCIILLLML